MNKAEITIVILLSLLLAAWIYRQHVDISARKNVQEPSAQINLEKEISVSNQASNSVEKVFLPTTNVIHSVDEGHGENEKIEIIENEDLALAVTSWGGAIKTVTVKKYKAHNHKDSSPLKIDFSGFPTLSYENVPGLTTNNDFKMLREENGMSIRISRKTREGLNFTRVLKLENAGYKINVTDIFGFDGDEQIYKIPHQSVVIGPMSLETSMVSSAGFSYIGVDTIAEAGGEGVYHWGSQIPQLFGHKKSFLSCGRQPVGKNVPLYINHWVSNSVLWAAVKNKFFVQIISPSIPAVDCEISAKRMANGKGGFSLEWVCARLKLKDVELARGASVERSFDCYIGPKLYSAISELGMHREDVMEFGRLKWVCSLLLFVMNKIYSVVPNYGIVIIILSLIVKGVFWPITHKSAVSMKKMQEIQPEVNEIRIKYKDKPQKMNQEIMELYRKHKINPMSGCLPLVVQLPVLFALFTVLRSAVELRYAPFLWIRDLSEPEGLLAGISPVAINILPIIMTLLTILQQYLTPASGDPQQKKMMMYMTLIMLFMFYNMASALVLYWTTSQFLSMAALFIQKYRKQLLQEASPKIS